MNRIYKVIWSKTKNCYVVASELAKRCTKSASSKKFLTTVVSLAILVGISGSAFAQDPVYYDDDYAEQITLEGPIGVGTKITNVANGLLSQASTDAVNGSQLYAVQQSMNAMNGTISNLSSSIAVAQTDISGIKTNYVTLNSNVNTLKTQIETGFNVTINGAKVKTVNPSDNSINFSAGNNVSIVNDNGTIKISATGGDGTVGAYYMENGRNTTVATRYDEGNNTIYSVAVNDFGTVASDSEGLVTGKTMHTELRPTADGSYITTANTTAQNLTALDTAVGSAVNSLAVSGQTLTYTKGDGSTGTVTLPAGGEGGATYTAGNGIEISSDNAISAKAGTNVTVDANGISVTGAGTVASDDPGLVTGKTVYDEVRPTQDGTYVITANTTGANLLALDSQVKTNSDAITQINTDLGGKANTSLDNITDDGKTVIQNATNVVSGDDIIDVTSATADGVKTYTIKANISANGEIAEGNTGLVSGGTVYDALHTQADATVDALDGKANIALNNINDDGKSVVRTLAQEAVKVVDGTNTTVTEGTDGNAKTYAVSVSANGQVAEGNTGIVTGGDVYDYVQGITGGAVAPSDLAAYAKKDASNVTDATAWGTAVGTGAVAENDGKLVTGGTVYSAIEAAKTDVQNYTDTVAATKSLNNLNDDGVREIKTIANSAITLENGTNTTVSVRSDGNDGSIYRVNVAGNGIVAEDNEGLVSGKTVFEEVRPVADGNYITISSTTGANLTALDTQVKANADAIEALQNSGGGVPANMVAYDDNTKATVTLAGQDGTTVKNVKAGTDTTDAVNVGQLTNVKEELQSRIKVTEDLLAGDWGGQTVKETIDTKVDNSTFNDYKEETANTIATMNTAIQGKANTDLDNITDTGKSVVRGLAQEAIDVKGEGAITVTSSVENDVKTYKVTVATDGVVEAGNTGIVTGDTVYNAIQDANTATQTALDGKANASLDNITDDAKDVIRDTVKDDLDAKADKDSVYTKDETDTKLSEKADLSYVDDELDKKADKTELDKKADKSYVDEGLDKKADKSELKKKANTDASNIDADKWAEKLGTGAVEEGNTGLVNGGAVYEALQDVTGNDIIKADADAGAIRIGNKAKYDDMDSVDISKSDGSTRVLKGIKTDANDPTSAANVAYVDGMAQGVLDNMKSGFERLDDRISETGAKAAALAGLHPFEIDGDQKWNIAAGVGTYDGKTSGAVGVFYRPTDRVMYNLASTIGDGKAMVSGGVSIALDKGITGMSKRQMAEEIRQIKAENAQLKEAIAYLMQKVEQGAVQNTIQK